MTASQLNASLLRLKLLDALRSGETSKVDIIIGELTSTKATIQNTDIVSLQRTVLHYAVQVAPLSVLQYLVSNADRYNLDINSQDHNGNTPLHLAAIASRFDVVKYLLSLPDINDTIVNLNKKQPVEETRDLNIAQLMQIERAKFVEKAAGQLRQYFSNRDFDNLEKLLVSNPRASELLDINGADPETGNTVLHEFIKNDDLQMCDWILKHGGDPFKRDKKGKLPIDLIHGKNDPLRKLLKVASKDQNIMDPVVNTSNAIKAGGAPTYKGYLRKWTNFATGYKLRYFQLDEFGILSYYTNQDDTNNACRGSLNLGFARLHLDSSEKLKFEIIGKNGMSWHLKANHPIETNRWVWTLQNAITLAKDNIKRKNRSGSRSQDDESVSSPTLAVPEPSNRNSNSEEPEGKKHRFHIPGRKSSSKHRRTDSSASLNSAVSEAVEEAVDSGAPLSRSSTVSRRVGTPNLVQIHENKGTALVAPSRLSVEDSYSYNQNLESDVENYDYDLDEDDFDSEDGSVVHSDPSKDKNEDPSGDQISSIKTSLDIQLSSLVDVFKQVSNSKGEGSESFVDASIAHVGLETLITVQNLIETYASLTQAKDIRLSRKYERQVEVSKLWENSIRQMEDEIHQHEAKLAEYEGKKKQLKKYFATTRNSVSSPSTIGPAQTISGNTIPAEATQGEEIPGHEEDQNQIIEEIFNDSDEEFFDADEFEEDEAEAEEDVDVPAITLSKADSEKTEQTEEPKDIGPTEQTDEIEENKVPPPAYETPGSVVGASIGESRQDSKSDANEKLAPETKEEPEYLEEKSSSKFNSVQQKVHSKIQQEGSFLGYENPPRTKLEMDEDNRPKVGLWGILKSMIGKDMTKMTLPVSFNEPTSLVQRLAEDIEYCNLLDQAATFEDSTLRLLYVSTFASSLYSSSIGRIAKPFNPLLGETFEYSRPDQEYRLFVEQVSHHPPVSACSAESPKWDYFGENAVESSFKGRSFDFKHLGKMFCIVRPDHGVVDSKGNKVTEELYSWKKVNTSVVGIIMGNPTVDNFGKMEVRNHTTGDTIIVDLKQRGWKASSAYQLSGQVLDRKGNPQWAMGGHWNSKIYGKKLSSHDSNPSLVASEGKISNDPHSGSKFLIWEVTPRPKVPFNLTAFATTLNGVDGKLKPWLAPTDTRLRPDQRAMEDGQYDLAADEKHRVEEKQRAARKTREVKKISYKPNWFVRAQHPVTGDSYWKFKGTYWEERKNHGLDNTGDIF